MIALKLVPHLVAFFGMATVALRGATRRGMLAGTALAGFLVGTGFAVVSTGSVSGQFSFSLVRALLALSFLLFCAVSFTALYQSLGGSLPVGWLERLSSRPVSRSCALFLASAAAGAVAGCRLGPAVPSWVWGALAAAAAVLVLAAVLLESRLPAGLSTSRAGYLALTVAFLLFSASWSTRLDLFAPLTMKVMKFTHDFVHQFFESMLIPDHLFIHSYLWGYIGLLFGKEVGFWGGLIIWFTPVVMVFLAIGLERLPSVAHLRQGAQRRRVLAEAIRTRRMRLVLPGLALVLLASAVYRSLYPSVEYWDPKPVPVTANAGGEIFLPRKGEIDLMDGKLHKYVFERGGKTARFFVLLTPSGKLTVDLDACAICKPDGYGQAEGTVLCYYCKTLIPLETVGKPGGCNPVPVPFTEQDDGIHLSGVTLINTWSGTVQSTTRTTEKGK
ncbi:hypothetical protein GMLC_40370 [Geomonas limicola]|uniref:Membrane iron-sulfur containing protein FtrD-like domain-containing protein n=1 Tax=Geomonas limicola TaxID=2740186 RepID=A0A6V8NCV0_9BACT|nr:DUF2318 domain-containing protein [Geomonas limicola]GFO70458.1 hypothetical protein GMLC_40370 [Geomonas limicola]